MSEWKKYDETTFTDFGSVGETMPAEASDMYPGGGKTMPEGGWAGGAGSFEETILDQGSDPTDVMPSFDDMKTTFSDYLVTTATGEKFRPNAGWLICIDGVVKGKDFRLYQGYTYIGRDSRQNQVVIPDDTISGVPSARILYDNESREFYIKECDGTKNFTYLNGKRVDGSTKLEPYDIIKLGNTKLLFIPLCTEKFAWGE